MQTFDPKSILDGRNTCRTVLDALDQLGVLDGDEKPVATVYAWELLCPNGQTPGMVLIATGSPGDCDRRYLRLPDSNTFRGTFVDGTPTRGAICELDRASITSDGAVLLSDGRVIRKVELQPGVPYQHYDFTRRQDFIVHIALKLVGEEDRCYRLVNEELCPGVRWLDYSAIRHVRLRNVKKLVDLIQKICYLRVTRKEIETTLKLAGMHHADPVIRSRKQTWQPNATMEPGELL
ncbi:MAG: hypothetical protein ABI150_12820 [Nitrobacter sp.]